MIRDLLGWLDYSLCAEIALALFVAAFAMILLRLFITPRSEMERCAALPLADGEEDARAQV